MLDHQWRLTAADGSVDFTFGTVDTGIQTSRAPDLGTREVRTHDMPLPREDGTATGSDYEQGSLLTFEANVLSADGDWAGQSDLLNAFQVAWRSRVFRAEPEDYAILRVQNAGRIRRVYGRPRRFAEADGDLTHDGFTTVVCDFATRDGKFYSEEIHTEQVFKSPPSSVGFSTPLVTSGVDPNTVAFQTETIDPDDLPGGVVIDGAETWPWIEIHGPIVNPKVDLGDLVVELDYTIADGRSVTLDPRPWKRRVVRDDGANLAGRLTWQTPPMGEWLLKPGAYQLTLRGHDDTGSSYATVNWREAFYRP